jgi:localization factor PodJL
MNSGLPQQVQDERERAWEIAQEAARRSGLSVDAWLKSVVADQAKPAQQDPAKVEDNPSAAMRPRYSDYDARHRRTSEDEPPRLSEVIAKLDRRLDQLISERRSPFANAERLHSPATNAATPLDQALYEIAERQHALDSGTPMAAAPAPMQSFQKLEQQLRQMSQQVEAMRPCALGSVVEMLRNDLAEIGAMVKEAMPRQAVEALESEVRALAERIDAKRHSGVDGQALAEVEKGLAEVRDALRTLRPAENLVGVDEAVQGLTKRIERVAGSDQEPATLEQLESAIVGLRTIVSHVASNEALGKLSEEVRELADKVDQVASFDVLSTLGQRIETIADALHSRHQQGQETRDIDAVVQDLTGKVERLQLTRGDQAAVTHLEDRIAMLVEKLDASDARLSHLEVIERGLSDLLVRIEQPRIPSALRGGGPEVDTIKHEMQRNQDALEAVHSTLGQLVDRLTTIEIDVRGGPPPVIAAPASAPAVARSSSVAASAGKSTAVAPLPALHQSTPVAAAGNPAPATAQDRRPIDPSLPPDHPLEPGSGGARGRASASPGERIAASEAALGAAKPPVIPDPAGKSNFIAAARRAAQAAANAETAAAAGKRASDSDTDPGSKKAAEPLSKRIRAMLVGASVVMLVLGSLQLAANLFLPADSDGDTPGQTIESTAPSAVIPPATTAEFESATQPAAPAPGRQSSLLPSNDSTPFTSLPPGIMLPTEPARQSANPVAPKGDRSSDAGDSVVTGSIQAPAAIPFAIPPATTPSLQPQAPVKAASADKLPAGLRVAATKGDPAAEFEIAVRFAEGRGVSQDFAAAAEWFERAAKQGLVPAQFRLGGLYEKGLGVKKNVDSARRLYLPAAEAGNAKAMHNLAVLFAEGFDGKPDYQSAAKWFHKAADHGVGDSQYNLGILYARGIGVEVNMAEAYKWFTLAAREGDADAAKKRDDVGSRLDPQSLTAARAAVKAWSAKPQPEAAVQVNAPAGGWDSVAASGAPKRRVGAKPEPTLPRAAQ